MNNRILVILFLIFTSCKDTNLKGIKESFDIDLSKSVSTFYTKEQWNDFNGDGYRIVNYVIKDNYKLEVLSVMKSKGADYKSKDAFENSVLEEYIVSDSVLCLYKVDNGEYSSLLFDYSQKMLLYFYEIY